MIKACHWSPHVLLAVVVSGSAAVYGRPQELREWKPRSDANYYQGTLSTQSGRTHIRTTGHWIYVESGAIVDINAFDASGKRLGNIFVGPAKQQRKTVKNVTPAPQKPEDFDFNELGYADDKNYDQTTGDIALYEPGHDDERNNGAASADATAARATDAGRLTTELSFQLGIGNERLTATAGVSDYGGTANIGGIALRGKIRQGRWFGATEVAAHSFATVETERDSTSGAESTTESSLLRTSGRILAFYDFFASGPSSRASSTLGLGAGIGGLRMPLLVTNDDPTDAAKLELQSILGPVVGLIYEHRLSPMHTAGLETTVQPVAIGRDGKAMSTNALAYWRHTFERSILFEIGLLATRDQASGSVDCGDLTDCNEASTASASIMQARFGLGCYF